MIQFSQHFKKSRGILNHCLLQIVCSTSEKRPENGCSSVKSRAEIFKKGVYREFSRHVSMLSMAITQKVHNCAIYSTEFIALFGERFWTIKLKNI